MKLKTKAKILSGLSCLSCTLGLTLPNNAYAAKDPSPIVILSRTIANDTPTKGNGTENLDDALERIFSISEEEEEFDPAIIGSELRDGVRNGKITLFLGDPYSVPTAKDLSDALITINNYMALTVGDPILINGLIRYLERHPIDISADHGILPHTAISLGQSCSEFLKFLIERCGIDPNIKDDQGRTLLHTAVMKQKKDALLTLLKNPKIRPDIEDNSHKTAYQYVLELPRTIVLPDNNEVPSSFRREAISIFNEYGAI